MKTAANSKCFDCNEVNPSWVSLNFGLFICLNCAGHHRSLGTHITSVRSIELDAFQPSYLVFLELGGNQSFRDYLQNIPLNIEFSSPTKKYGVPEVLYYSEILKAKVESREPIPFDRDYWFSLVRPPESSSGKTVSPWVPDSGNSNCMICSKSFTLLFRKHHCRRCGKRE
jgi:hypothetical protein